MEKKRGPQKLRARVAFIPTPDVEQRMRRAYDIILEAEAQRRGQQEDVR